MTGLTDKLIDGRIYYLVSAVSLISIVKEVIRWNSCSFKRRRWRSPTDAAAQYYLFFIKHSAE